MDLRRTAVVSLAGLALLTTSCGGSDAGAVDSTEARGTAVSIATELVDPARAESLIGEGDVTVIDVRTPEEFAEGHLADAELIDFYADSFADDLAQLDRDGRYVVYCRSGNRSGQAVDIMESLGFTEVYDVDGGVQAWAADGLPLVP